MNITSYRKSGDRIIKILNEELLNVFGKVKRWIKMNDDLNNNSPPPIPISFTILSLTQYTQTLDKNIAYRILLLSIV